MKLVTKDKLFFSHFYDHDLTNKWKEVKGTFDFPRLVPKTINISYQFQPQNKSGFKLIS
jgi:hypothetical protein